MMTLYVFFVIIFGFYNLALSQMTDLITKTWDLCNNEIVYGDNELNSNEKKLKCSEIETIAIKMFQVADNIFISIVFLYGIFLVIVGVTTINLHLDGFHLTYLLDFENTTDLDLDQKKDSLVLIGSLFLSTMFVLFTIPMTLATMGVHILKPNDKNRNHDDILFEIWWKYKCHRIKNVKCQKNTQPLFLYSLLKKKIESGEIIDASDEEKESIANLPYKSLKQKIDEKIIRELKRDFNRNP